MTPPLGTGPGWNAERIAWFRSYHRAAAAGLDGPAHEKSWAVMCDGKVAGSIRLKRMGHASPDQGTAREATAGDVTAETGIWLGRGFRSRGVGAAALGLVLAEARSSGLERLVASTAAANLGAQRILASVDAILTHDHGGTVTAVVELGN